MEYEHISTADRTEAHRPLLCTTPPGPLFGPVRAWRFVYRPKDFYAWLRRRYGDVATLHSGGPRSVLGFAPRLVLALAPDTARQVFRSDPGNYSAFQKEAFTGIVGPNSLWVLDGERHRNERRLLAPEFHIQCIRHYGEVIRRVALVHSDAWQAGQRISAYDGMLDISRDVILRLMFGIQEGPSLIEGRAILTDALESAHPLTAFTSLFQSAWFPPWVRSRRARRRFDLFSARRLAEHRVAGNNVHDVLAVMASARHTDGTTMSDSDIFDELLTISLAGHETTAVALAWALYELGRHPSVLGRLREEVDALGPEPDLDALVRQPYLGAVCDETLRLHTVLTEVARLTRRPLELFGHTLPEGIGVGVGICAIHQDPDIYPEPDSFRPERFLERSYSPFEFLPFGGGHRRCLGAAFSDYEMRIVLATVMTRWEFELAGADRDVRHHISMGPKHGVPIRLKLRR